MQLSVIIRNRVFYEPISFTIILPGIRISGISKDWWCKELTEINIDDRVMYIQLLGVFKHICVDLQPLFGNCFREAVAVSGKCTGIGNISFCTDLGVFASAVSRSDCKTMIKKTGIV